jgi:hypothetical protein
MTVEEIIRRDQNVPIGQLIETIAPLLAKRSVFLATDDAPATTRAMTATQETRIRFKVAHDNQGRQWAYGYTSEEELLKALPQGSPYVKLELNDFFRMIDEDAKFAGIMLNSGGDSSCPIPRELFDRVKAGLQAGGGAH